MEHIGDLLRKPRVELAVLVMLLMCVCHLRSDEKWTPRHPIGYMF